MPTGLRELAIFSASLGFDIRSSPTGLPPGSQKHKRLRGSLPEAFLLCTHALHLHRLETRMNTEVQKMGWLMGLEPTTTGITILDSTN